MTADSEPVLPSPPRPRVGRRAAAICCCAGLGVLLVAVWAANRNILSLAEEKIRLKRARKEMFALEKEGKSDRPAHEILMEAEWIADSTPDLARLRDRRRALEEALRDPADLFAADEQSPSDGSWGKWYTEWFFKLDTSYDQIARLADERRVPQYPVRFLDRINSPGKLVAHLNRLLTSDPKADGLDHRRELNETISDLMRLILRDQPANYAFAPGLKAALLDWLLRTARDPHTGYWGPRYRRHDPDGFSQTTSLSITFHIVSFLHGEVSDWPKVIATTLAIKDERYPDGWLAEDGYLNHNNMDVARLFSLGWSRSTPDQQAAMRVEIRKMLGWCLRDSLQPDGSFKLQDNDDSVETSVAFGTSFLTLVGYFDRSKRFWTDEEFPEAAEVRARIIGYICAHLGAGGEGGFYYRDTLDQLGAPEFAR